MKTQNPAPAATGTGQSRGVCKTTSSYSPPSQQSKAAAIRAEIAGGDRACSAGLSATGAAPVLALCRLLVEAGADPGRSLHAYRGALLCLAVRSIGAAAQFDINSKGTGFTKWHVPVRIASRVREDGNAEAKWETERTITDPAEHDAAIKARTKARVAITRVCTASAFGLLCPETAEPDLEKAVAEARKIVDDFNAQANLTRIGVYVITGRIAPDDVEAVRAINSEVRDLLADMEEGLKNLDVKAVREAASKAKSIGAMLSPDAAARITIAIEAARASAKRIVQAGEQVAAEIDNRVIATIKEARTAFLDLDDAKEIASPKAKARAVDLAPSETVSHGGAKARQLEME